MNLNKTATARKRFSGLSHAHGAPALSFKALSPGGQRTALPCDACTLLAGMIEAFLTWAFPDNLESLDWWDIWGTAWGGFAKRTFQNKKAAGAMLLGPVVLLDLAYPEIRKYFVRKRPFAISHAQIGMGLLNLHDVTRDPGFLEKAEDLVAPLLAMSSCTGPGLGWGIDLRWMTTGGIVVPNVPCNTQTAYVYEFFKRLLEMTRKPVFHGYLQRISRHVADDFLEWSKGEALVSSYFSRAIGGDQEDAGVVNANSYRAMILLDAGARFGDDSYTAKGQATLHYVLSMQSQDGSWPYAEDRPFVDHYHTCFVLKNLLKIRPFLGPDMDLLRRTDIAIRAGLSYYFSHLFDKRGYPIPFAISPRMTLHNYDSYDLAESISLASDLPGEQRRIAHLCQFAKRSFQTQGGWFLFRNYPFPHREGIPYIRHGNAPMFLALTKALKALLGP